MSEDDFDEFGDMLDAVCGLLSKGTYVPSPVNTALFYRALARFRLDEVRAGFDAHVSDAQRGRFVPVPADIVAQIEGLVANDRRPAADEAWAIALQAADEASTIVWTSEISVAWGIARTVYDAGDKVGARVAFRDAYTRLVDEARERRAPPVWSVSIGFDAEMRHSALQRAADQGRLPAADRHLLIDYSAAPSTLALGYEGNGQAVPAALARLRELRAQLTAPLDAPSRDAQDREATKALQEEAARRVQSYQGDHGAEQSSC
jgi:hypothetical protein